MSETLRNSGVNLVNGQGELLAELLAGNTYQLTPIKGESYQLLQAIELQTQLASNLIALRSGNDLVIRFADGLEVVMLDYFEICLQPVEDSENSEAEAQLDCSITVASDSAEGMTIGSGPVSQYELASDASPRIVYAHGDDTALASIVDSNAGMEDIYAAYILSGTAPAVAATAFSPALLGAAGLGLGAAAGGGGGATAVAAAPIVMKFTGSVVLGPVVSGHGLTVTAFKADGSELARGTVNADGTFTINSTVAYTGNVLIVVVDTNTAHDYFDEGTRQSKDLDTDLRAVTTVAGAGDYTVSVNALTELVVKDYTQAHGNTLNGTTTASIAAGNRSVADAFGLSNVDLINDEAVAIVDAQGNSNPNANDYGRALAAISGMEHGQSKTTQGVINDVASGLSGSTLSTAVKYELVAGARVAGVDALDMATRLGLPNPQQIKDSWEIIYSAADGVADNKAMPTTASIYTAVGITGLTNAGSIALLGNAIDALGSSISSADINAVNSVAELQAMANASNSVHALDMHDTGMTRVEGDVTYKVYVEPGVNIELWIDEKATVVFSA